MDNELALYGSFINQIKELIHRRQYEAMKRVNTELIQLYWEIGRNRPQTTRAGLGKISC